MIQLFSIFAKYYWGKILIRLWARYVRARQSFSKSYALTRIGTAANKVSNNIRFIIYYYRIDIGQHEKAFRHCKDDDFLNIFQIFLHFSHSTRQIMRGYLLVVANMSLCRYMLIRKLKKCLEVQDSHRIFAV